jgi:hypothetical protein
MSQRFTCPQGHSWEPAADDPRLTGAARNVCPYCGAEPGPPTEIQSEAEVRAPRKSEEAVDDLPSVVAADVRRPAPKKAPAKRSAGALVGCGCLGLIVFIVALAAGIGGWYYYSTRDMEMKRARAVVERHLNDEYQNRWKIENESMSPSLNEAAFEGKADPTGTGAFNHKFTVILSKYRDGKWYVDQ